MSISIAVLNMWFPKGHECMVDGLTSWGLVLGVVVGIIGCKMTEVWLARVDCVGGRGGGEMSHGGDSRMIVDVFSDLLSLIHI